MPERDREHLIALYDGEILWTDGFVGRFLDDLDEWGLAEKTIVCVTSDHGTEFFEHDWKAHRTTLYDEQIRIPLVLRYPGQLEPGRRVSEQTRIVDLGPTLLELAGLPPAPDVMGFSLVPLARGEPAGFDTTAVSELWSFHRKLRSVRTPEYKFIQDLGDEGFSWYDLEVDPGEQDASQRVKDGVGARAAARYLSATRELGEWIEKRPGEPLRPDLVGPLPGQLERFGYTGAEEDE